MNHSMSLSMSNGISLFIIVFTLANILACGWLMWWSARVRVAQDPKHKSDAGGQIEKTGHVWDGDLEEYNNPLPRWWLWLFIITIVFGLGYLLMYPGLGNFAGKLGWTQLNQHASEVHAAQARLESRLAGMDKMSIEEIASKPEAMSIARNLFGLYCTTCHGSDARGARGFPNLADKDWLWGGLPETILQTISQGRTGVMPPWGDALGEQGVEEVMAYVVMLSGKQAPADMVAKGRERYSTVCVACHGADAKGNQALGAPNLTDNIWLYGSSLPALRETITKGRNGAMPAHAELLGPVKTKLLAAYVYSLSNDQH
jgi:cytochrome c oxidase cbb3-type subunit III